jgi:hypothetical protein
MPKLLEGAEKLDILLIFFVSFKKVHIPRKGIVAKTI